jgi:hypothetical protein
MNDYSGKYLPKIEKNKIPMLDLGEGIYPDYNGLSLLNLPASICHWMGAPKLSHPPLQIPELNSLASDIEQIVIVLVDALSFSRFRDWTLASSWVNNSTLGDGFIFPLTSVVPSTTSSVLTSLWTGHSPAEHGILGYELFLREFGLVANMITHSPASFDGRSGLLYQAGFIPEKTLPVPSLGPHLAKASIEVSALLAKNIMHSGLSRMHYPGVDVHGFTTVSDLWHIVKQLASLPLKKRRIIWVYYGAVDTLSHTYSPDSDQAKTEYLSFIQSMHDIFVNDFSDEVHGRSLLLLLSDHGQITTPNNPHFELSKHPSLTNRLHMLPTGENRFSYLHIRPGQMDAVLEYIHKTWPNSFHALNSHYALEVGLFGPGDPSKEAYHRIGDQIIISKDNNYLWWASKSNSLRGRHGGLSFDEMIVPLYALPLKR